MIETPASLAFVWFSFGPDFACLRESVKSVMAAAVGSRLHVAMDALDPCTADEARELDGMGVHVFVTDWDRRGNLNGLEHLKHQLHVLLNECPEGGAVVKIDSDVILQDARWLAQHDWQNVPVAAVTQPAWWFQGGTYGASGRALKIAQELLPKAESICPNQGPRWPEDQVFGELIAFHRPEFIGHYHGWPVGPAVAHYDYAGNAPFEAYRKFWTVNFGGRANIKAPATLRRSLAAATMRAFREGAAAVTRDR